MQRPVVASTLEVLRESTAELHESLHEHPLIVQLFQRPTRENYRLILTGFYAFYAKLEPTLVAASQQWRVGYLYPAPVRTQRLAADLRVLGGGTSRLSDGGRTVPVRSLAELAGCLYVVKGSSLGSRVILRRLSRRLELSDCCRFLHGDAADTNRLWREFLGFLHNVGRDDRQQDAAVAAARQTFADVSDCLWAFQFPV